MWYQQCSVYLKCELYFKWFSIKYMFPSAWFDKAEVFHFYACFALCIKLVTVHTLTSEFPEMESKSVLAGTCFLFWLYGQVIDRISKAFLSNFGSICWYCKPMIYFKWLIALYFQNLQAISLSSYLVKNMDGIENWGRICRNKAWYQVWFIFSYNINH